MNSFLNIQVRILAQQAQATLRQLNTQMGSLGSGNIGTGRLDRLGSQMQWLGRQIEYNFTVPLAIAGAAATKMALDNEAAFVRITKVYGDATHGADYYKQELESLKKAFVALSDEFGIAQADALNIAADWAAAGASGIALAKAVELTMKTMVLGELNAGKATQSLIAIQAQYGLSISQLADTIDILNMVENQTGISMAGLIDGFARTAGVARSSGVGVRELAADLAALTPATGSAVNAGNALKTIFSRLLSPTKQTADILGLMGINTHAVAWESSNAQEKLLLMATSFMKLSDAQKGLVSSIIASRYQVNRFEVLMRELTSTNGYYQRALQSTTDMNAVYAQSQKELNQVLTSSPKRLEVIWTMLKNAAADIIQPMIPLVLWLATAIMRVVQAFSNLNPAVQKFILFGLALLAAVGPIVRYLGAIQVLIFELGGLFGLLLRPLTGVVTMFRLLVLIPIQTFFNVAALAMRGLVISAIAVGTALPRIFAVMTTASEIIIAGFVRTVDFLVVAGWAALVTGTSFFLNVMLGLWGIFWGRLGPLVTQGMALVGILWARGLAAMEAVLLAFAAASGRIWRLITTSPLILLQGLWTAITTGFVRLLPLLRVIGLAFVDAITGPIGLAITAAVLLILVFWKQIKQIWNNAVNFFRNGGGVADAFAPLGRAAVAVKNLVLRAFNALPNGIRSAMLAVVNIIAAAAKAVYHWFSYLNPFAKHSPSLVDNVKNGSQVIQGHYADTHAAAMQAKDGAASVTAAHASATSAHTSIVSSAAASVSGQATALSSLGSAYDKAAADLDRFEKAVRAVERAAEQAKYDTIRKQLLAIAKDAVPAFDQLLRELYPLEDQLKVVQKSLDAQQAVVDGLKSKLDDANAALKTQQDVLDSMKQSVDKFSNQVNAINGDLEVLGGTREALRLAGAGSDILKGYDDQIGKLKEQKQGINDQLAAAQKAYNDQKKLVDDLTASRDKLQAGYDEESKKLQKIQDQYDKIKQRIQDITSAIQDFASAADALQQSKKGGKGGVGSDFNAGAGANFPDVGGTGGIGREGGIADQSALIDQFTKDIKDKTKNLFGLFNFLDPIKKGWNAAWGWVKSNFGPIASMVGNFFGHLFDGVGNPLKGLNFSGYIDAIKSLFDGIIGFAKDAWNLIGPPLKEIGKVIWNALGRAFQQIGPELAKFKDLIKPMGDLWRELAPILKVIGGILGGVVLLALNVVAHVLANTLGPALNLIISIIRDVIIVLRGLIEFIVGVFTGNWSLAWKGIVDFFGAIWDAIWQTIKNAGLVIWGIVKGIVEGVVGFFKWAYDILLGHSIIPDIVNGIISFFTMLKDVVVAIWNAFMAGLKWVWDNILRPVFDAIKAAIHLVAVAFGLAVDSVKFYWNLFIGAGQYAWGIIRGVIQAIRDKWNDIVDGIRGMVNAVKGWIDNFVNAVSGIKNRIAGAFSGLFDGLKNAFKSAVNWIIGKWNGLQFSLGPFSVGTPDIPYLAKGGLVANQAMAIVGEGRKGFPEYVIPTDPQYRDRALQLFQALGNELGINNVVGGQKIMSLLANQLTRGTTGDRIQFFASGGVLGRASIRGSGSNAMIVVAPQANNTEYHFHGNLEFPNVKSGNDAREFVKNLQALVGS